MTRERTLRFDQESGSLPAPSLPGAPAAGGGEGTATTQADGAGSPGTNPDAGGGSPMNPLLLFGLLFVFMWFFIIRPERKRQKERTSMLGAAKKGDHIVTTGGMHGQIAAMDEHTFTLKVADNLRLKFDRNAIARVASAKGGKEGAAAKGGKKAQEAESAEPALAAAKK